MYYKLFDRLILLFGCTHLKFGKIIGFNYDIWVLAVEMTDGELNCGHGNWIIGFVVVQLFWERILTTGTVLYLNPDWSFKIGTCVIVCFDFVLLG